MSWPEAIAVAVLCLSIAAAAWAWAWREVQAEREFTRRWEGTLESSDQTWKETVERFCICRPGVTCASHEAQKQKEQKKA